ncbi:MAG: hypothetical protein ACFFD4_26755 [Candidatus Odinarchaeota archaeon]
MTADDSSYLNAGNNSVPLPRKVHLIISGDGKYRVKASAGPGTGENTFF